MTLINHQREQQKVINKIADQINNNSLNFSTVSSVDDFVKDPRICLTSIHLPHRYLLDQVQQDLIEPLKKIEANFHYYPSDCLHMTIKNVRVINHPPHFSEEDVQNAERIFSETIPQHKKFNVYFYRLLLFPNSLALIGTTDEELDSVILDLDNKLTISCIPDDKVYTNSQYFFSNMTLARFNTSPSKAFRQKIVELSESLKFDPYQVDSVTLLTCNAVLKNKQLRGTWELK
jgi:2'-5' RNA ligase